MKTKFLLLCLFASTFSVLIQSKCFAQTVCNYPIDSCNLVGNGDFESYSGSSVGFLINTGLKRACNWTSHHSEYLHTQSLNSDLTIPFNLFTSLGGGCGVPPLFNGNAYAGFINYWKSNTSNPNPDQWEFISAALNNPLQVGRKYLVEFYFRKSPGAAFTASTIGIGLSKTPFIDSTHSSFVYPTIPVGTQIINNTNLANLSNSTSWSRAAGVITASAEHKFITIGCYDQFAPVSITGNQPGCNTSLSNSTYYFIDDVRVMLLPEFDSTLTICKGDTVHFTFDPACVANQGSSNYIWSNGLQTIQGSTVTFVPQTTGIYNVFLMHQGDSIRIGQADITLKDVPNWEDSTYYICEGDSISIVCPPNATCTWLQNGSLAPLPCPLTHVADSGSHTYQITCSHVLTNCKTETELTFITVPVQQVLDKDSLLVCIGNTVTLQGDATGLYSWSSLPPDPLLVNQQNNNPVQVQPIQNGTYTVMVEDTLGCISKDTIRVKLSFLSPPVILASLTPTCQRLGNGGDLGGDPGNNVTDTCFVACAFSTVQYYTVFQPNVAYQWAVSGAQSFTFSGDTLIVTWSYAGNGSITLTVRDSAGCEETTLACVNINAEPIAGFTSSFVNTSGVIEGCLQKPILFYNTSQANAGGQITQNTWNFGDGTILQASGTVSHSYAQAGIYTVQLIVRNGCGCTDTIVREVEIGSNPGPVIESCKTSLCPGAIVEYSTLTTGCATYDWSVIGGTILSPSPYGTTIRVRWGSGQARPARIRLRTPNCLGLCDVPTELEISILPDNLAMNGPTNACEGEESTYSVPLQPGTTYQWSVQGGVITFGQATNLIRIRWNVNAASPKVTLVYNNEFIQCGGEKDLDVQVRPRYTIQGSAEVCSTGMYTTSLGTPMQWILTTGNGANIGVQSNVVSYQPTFAASGGYVVTATPINLLQSCNATAFLPVQSLQGTLPFTGALSGPTVICPGKSYPYSISGVGQQSVVQWQVTGGSPASFTGNATTITWGGTGPYSIKLNAVNATAQCASSDTVIAVASRLSTFSPAILGPDTVCANTSATYSLSQTADSYEWQILDPIRGSIVQGQGERTIGIQWNNTGSATTAILRVRPRLCDQVRPWVVKPIVIRIVPTPALTLPASVCQWDTAAAATSAGGTAYRWSTSEGMVTGPQAAATSLVFTSVGTAQVTLTVQSPDGCATDATAFAQVQVLERTSVLISTIGKRIYCTLDTILTELSTVPVQGYSYSWSKDNSTIPGATTADYTATQAGTYTLKVNTPEGCAATSLPVDIAQQPCTTYRLINCYDDSLYQQATETWQYLVCCAYELTIDGIVSADYDTTCNAYYTPAEKCPELPNLTIQLDTNACGRVYARLQQIPANWTAIRWSMGDVQPINPLLLNNTTAVGYSYLQPGNYTIAAEITIADSSRGTRCIYRPSVAASYPYKPGLRTNVLCDTGGRYVELVNTTLLGTGPTPVAWDLSEYDTALQFWNYLDSLPPGRRLRYPVNTDSAHTWRLELAVGSLTNTCTLDTLLQIPAAPRAQFSAPPVACAGVPVAFDDLSSPQTDLVQWLWNFGDGATLIRKQGVRTYDQTNDFPVSLTITNRFGCTHTAVDTMAVKANEIDGGFLPSPILAICAGDSISISWESIGVDVGPFAYVWSTGATSDTLVVTQTTALSVWVVSQSSNCRSRFGPVDAVVHPRPVAALLGTRTYCLGQEVYLHTPPAPGRKFTWWSGSDTLGTGTGIYFTPDSTGLLTVGLLATDTATGCGSDTAQAVLAVAEPPAIPAISISGGPAPYCEGTLYTLTAAATAPYLSWNTGTIGTTITATLPAIYRVQAVDSIGCSSADSIAIHPLPNLDYFLTGCYEVCSQGPPFAVPPVPGLYLSYTWWLNGQAISSAAGAVQPLPIQGSGAYTLSLTTYEGCADTSAALDLSVEDCQVCDASIELQSIHCYELEDGSRQYVVGFFIVSNAGLSGTFTATVAGITLGTFSTQLIGSGIHYLYLSDPLILSLLTSGEHCIHFVVTTQADTIAGTGPQQCTLEWCTRLETDCITLPSCTDIHSLHDIRCTGYAGNQQAIHTLYLKLGDPHYVLALVQSNTMAVQVLSFDLLPSGLYALQLAGDWESYPSVCLRLVQHDPRTGALCSEDFCIPLEDWLLYVNQAGGCPLNRAAQSSTSTAAANIAIYPNPAQNTVTLAPAWHTDRLHVRVLDLTGRMVHQDLIPVRKGSALLHLHHLTAGSYTLITTDADGLWQRTLLILAP